MAAVATDPVLVLGSTMPRLWTPPLVTGDPGPCGCGCALTPHTSYGFDVDDFAQDIIETPLDPWERWLVIHAGELLPDGRPRFRTVLAIVARQQGKSLLMRVLILYWLFVEKQPLVLATSTDRSYAKAAWRATCEAAKDNPYLSEELPARPTVEQIGEEELRTIHSTKYRFAAVNRRAGRSLTVHRLVLDEIREHANFDAWGASTKAMNAVPTAQAIAVSNQGDDSSVVLDWIRDSALAYLETGEGNPRLGLFEWSAPRGSDPTDLRALAQANPNLGRRTDADTLLGEARQVVVSGGDALASFKTEVMCIRVDRLDPAIDPEGWAAGLDPGDLDDVRDRVALCVDVSLDGTHAALLAAALLPTPDGTSDAGPRVRVEAVKAWSGPHCTRDLRRDLPALVRRIQPRVFGWFPAGPAAAVAADLADPKKKARRRTPWPPPGVMVEEIRADVPAVCMGLAEMVRAGQIAQPGDPMLDAHIVAAEKAYRGDAWVFVRKGAGHVNAAYAAAGAVHLARTMPPAPPRPKVISSKRHAE